MPSTLRPRPLSRIVTVSISSSWFQDAVMRMTPRPSSTNFTALESCARDRTEEGQPSPHGRRSLEAILGTREQHLTPFSSSSSKRGWRGTGQLLCFAKPPLPSQYHLALPNKDQPHQIRVNLHEATCVGDGRAGHLRADLESHVETLDLLSEAPLKSARGWYKSGYSGWAGVCAALLSLNCDRAATLPVALPEAQAAETVSLLVVSCLGDELQHLNTRQLFNRTSAQGSIAIGLRVNCAGPSWFKASSMRVRICALPSRIVF